MRKIILMIEYQKCGNPTDTAVTIPINAAIKHLDSNRFCCSRPLCCSFVSVAPRPPPYKFRHTKITLSAYHLRKNLPLFLLFCSTNILHENRFLASSYPEITRNG